MSGIIQITESRLEELLAVAAERGSLRAIQRIQGAQGKEYLSLKEALEYLGVSRSYLDKLVNTGVIRKNDYSKSTTKKYYLRKDCERYREKGPVPLPRHLIDKAIKQSA